MHVRSLLEDGSLRMECAPSLLPAALRWLPLLPSDGPLDPGGSILALREAAGAPPAPPPGRRTLALGRVEAWVDGEGAALAGPDGLRGTLDLGAGRAGLHAPAGADDPALAERVRWEVYSACTLSAALLLGRMGRALAHAAAVARPGGGAWLLVGDTHAGKTTTTANLLAAGWAYLSDDHVVLGRGGDGGVRVEGWPRPFHLDEGWERGETRAVRGETDPRARWPGRWRRSAPLAGILLPRIEAPRPTALEPAAAADALAALVRQSPWLLADGAAAPGVLALLADAARLPVRALRLGRDAYADPAVLVEALAPLGL